MLLETNKPVQILGRQVSLLKNGPSSVKLNLVLSVDGKTYFSAGDYHLAELVTIKTTPGMYLKCLSDTEAFGTKLYMSDIK